MAAITIRRSRKKDDIDTVDVSLKLEVCDINDTIGKGLFVKRPFEQGELICEYKGDLLKDQDEIERREKAYKDNYHNYMYYFSDKGRIMCVDSTNFQHSYGRYANDAPHKIATAFVKKRIVLNDEPVLQIIAKKALKIGDEVTYDYQDPTAPWRKSMKKKEVEMEEDQDIGKQDEILQEGTGPTCSTQSRHGQQSNNMVCKTGCTTTSADKSERTKEKVTRGATGGELQSGTSETSTVTDDTCGKQDEIMQEGTATSQEKGKNVTSTKGIKVLGTNNQRGKRTYDKIFYCYFCQKAIKEKIRRHLEFVHKNKGEIKDCFIEKDLDKREAMFTRLINMGNHLHNTKVIEEGEGTLIVKYRPRSTSDNVVWEDYLPCETCFGYYAKYDLWKHAKRCKSASSSETKGKRVIESSRMLLPEPPGVSKITNKLLCTLAKDEISRVIKSDSLILKLAEKLYLKHGHDRDQYAPVRNTLREIARLLIELRRITKQDWAGLEEFISPVYFPTVLVGARNIAGFNEHSHVMSTPSLALKVGHTIRKCAKIMKARGLVESDQMKVDKAVAFVDLCEIEWTEQVSTHALRSLSEKKRNSVRLIPLTEDCVKLTKWLREKASKAYELLGSQTKEVSTTAGWSEFRDYILSIIILFNRRRQGEASRMKLVDFKENHQWRYEEEDVTQTLSPFERNLCKIMHRIEIVGKRGRTVPVLLTGDMKKWLDSLVEKRSAAGVAEENIYIFACANQGSMGHVRGCDTLRVHSGLCGAKAPELLRSTKLRKQIATLSQILNLADNELDSVAKFLGHDIRVHREFYRLPEYCIQVAKVSKMLIALDQGKFLEQKGKRLEEIEVALDEEVEMEECDTDSGEDEVESSGSDGDDTDESAGRTNSSRNQSNVVKRRVHVDTGTNKKQRKVHVAQGKVAAQDKPGPSSQTQSTKRKVKKGAAQGKRVAWTTEQREAVKRYFSRNIDLQKLPGKKDIEVCQKVETCLKSRPWTNIKDFVRHQIEAKKKKMRPF